jgi:hypothetical protein
MVHIVVTGLERVKKRRLERLGHVIRMDKTRVGKKNLKASRR